MLARDEVEVAVAVEVAERGRRVSPTSRPIERVGRTRAQRRRPDRGAARVLEVVEVAAMLARHEVEVTVAVEVAERGLRRCPHVVAVERIGRAGARDEGRARRAARVLEVGEVAVELARDEVEVAVAVEVAERSRRDVAHVLAVERVGGARARHQAPSRGSRSWRTCRIRRPRRGRGRRRRRGRRARATSRTTPSRQRADSPRRCAGRTPGSSHCPCSRSRGRTAEIRPATRSRSPSPSRSPSDGVEKTPDVLAVRGG